MFYSDDPLMDFDRYDREQSRRLAERPVCVECDEPIQDETAFYINGEWICESCMDSYRQVVPEA